jgi:hypothetical protein
VTKKLLGTLCHPFGDKASSVCIHIKNNLQILLGYNIVFGFAVVQVEPEYRTVEAVGDEVRAVPEYAYSQSSLART